MAEAANIRVTLPFHLCNLSGAPGEVTLSVEEPVTLSSVLDALERKYPVLQGTIREHETLRRRPRVRFYADREDISHEPPDSPLPEAVVTGREPLMVIGAISGG